MGPRSGAKMKTTDITRDDWLSDRRKTLLDRMRRRRKSRIGKKSKPPIRLF
jgi:hypothetical protein